ncbi:MAG: hypothetical protein LBD63_04135 [Mycoplasmataceae bacterium]|nr:hypothetical protein [Mycoplasmataceae bacterium]
MHCCITAKKHKRKHNFIIYLVERIVGYNSKHVYVSEEKESSRKTKFL